MLQYLQVFFARLMLFTLLLMSGWVTAADIRSTPHNLTRTGALVAPEAVCVFCHTPMTTPGQANRSEAAAQPSWQPSLSSTFSFVIYDDIGRLQFGDKPAVGSQSIACLSCHDANQAFSVMSGETDHPFGVPYRGFTRGRERLPSETVVGDESPSRSAKHLKSLEDFRVPSSGVVDSRSVWWVSASGTSAVRGRADLPLYARQIQSTGVTGVAGVVAEVPYIECSSCHDPHVSNKLFLRVNNDESRLCLTCHDK